MFWRNRVVFRVTLTLQLQCYSKYIPIDVVAVRTLRVYLPVVRSAWGDFTAVNATKQTRYAAHAVVNLIHRVEYDAYVFGIIRCLFTLQCITVHGMVKLSWVYDYRVCCYKQSARGITAALEVSESQKQQHGARLCSSLPEKMFSVTERVQL